MATGDRGLVFKILTITLLYVLITCCAAPLIQDVETYEDGINSFFVSFLLSNSF